MLGALLPDFVSLIQAEAVGAGGNGFAANVVPGGGGGAGGGYRARVSPLMGWHHRHHPNSDRRRRRYGRQPSLVWGTADTYLLDVTLERPVLPAEETAPQAQLADWPVPK